MINNFDNCIDAGFCLNLGNTTANVTRRNIELVTTANIPKESLEERLEEIKRLLQQLSERKFSFEFVENITSEKYGLIEIDKSEQIKEMINSNTVFFLIYEEINQFTNNYFLENAYFIEAEMYIYTDREVEDLESIVLSIKIKEKCFEECLDIWEDFEKKLRDIIVKKISDSPASMRKKLIEINRKLTIKIDSYD